MWKRNGVKSKGSGRDVTERMTVRKTEGVCFWGKGTMRVEWEFQIGVEWKVGISR